MVIHVVKAVFLPGLTEELNPANAVVAGLSGVPLFTGPDTVTALPKQALYQAEPHPDIKLFCLLFVVGHVVKTDFDRNFRKTKSAIKQAVMRVFGIISILRYANAYTLPNHPRSQLRHTPIILNFLTLKSSNIEPKSPVRPATAFCEVSRTALKSGF
ncbi:MAG: hypothetical protein ACOYKJ_07970 [Candidatus Howiella sp.]